MSCQSSDALFDVYIKPLKFLLIFTGIETASQSVDERAVGPNQVVGPDSGLHRPDPEETRRRRAIRVAMEVPAWACPAPTTATPVNQNMCAS